MTEIKIEKKRPIWPVLLILLVVALVVYFVFFNDTKQAVPDQSTITDTTANSNGNSMVAAFTAYVYKDTAEMSLDHEYTYEALLKLADATREVATRVNYDDTTGTTRAKILADKITNDPFSTNHAGEIREAAVLLSNTLEQIQKQEFPALDKEVSEVKTAAAAIDADVLTLDQRQALKKFFRQAADLLQQMI